MIDLVERPEMVHAAVDRVVDSYLCELDQFEALNLLSGGTMTPGPGRGR